MHLQRLGELTQMQKEGKKIEIDYEALQKIEEVVKIRYGHRPTAFSEGSPLFNIYKSCSAPKNADANNNNNANTNDTNKEASPGSNIDNNDKDDDSQKKPVPWRNRRREKTNGTGTSSSEVES